MNIYRIGGAALNQTPLDWADNLANIREAISAARDQGLSVLCLPELAITGYGCEDSFYSEEVTRRALQQLEALRKESDDMVIAVGLPIIFEHTVYNAAAVLADEQLAGFYVKEKLAGDGLHYEPRWFHAWPDDRLYYGLEDAGWEHVPVGEAIFDIDGLRVGIEICEDAWHGDRPGNRHFLRNADVILNLSASHFALGKTRDRVRLVQESSRSFNCAYVLANLLGNEAGRVLYDGEILVAAGGELLARNTLLSFADYNVLGADVNVSLLRRDKRKHYAFVPDPPVERRVPVALTHPLPQASPALHENGRADAPSHVAPFLDRNQELYHAVTLGLFDYLRKSRNRGFVLSLSGGADSSACAVMAVHALQRAQAELGQAAFAQKLAYMNWDPSRPLAEQFVTCLYQATSNSSSATEASAQELARELGTSYHRWNVQPAIDYYRQLTEEALGRELSWERDDLTLQNIQSRARVPALWMMANQRAALLLTTANRSEVALGYATMDGDTSGGLAPVGGLAKHELLEWLRWAEAALELPALRYVNQLTPTAELRPAQQDQSDEEDLMPYPILTAIENCAIRDYLSPLEAFQRLRGIAPDGQLKNYVHKFYTLWARTQWKRERYAPSFHLDDKNLDPRSWCRFPILNGSFKAELAELDQYVQQLAEAPSQR